MKQVLFFMVVLVMFYGCATTGLNVKHDKIGSDFYINDMKVGEVVSHEKKQTPWIGSKCSVEIFRIYAKKCKKIILDHCLTDGRWYMRLSAEDRTKMQYKDNCSLLFFNNVGFMRCIHDKIGSRYYITYSQSNIYGYNNNQRLRVGEQCYKEIYEYFEAKNKK